MEPRGKPKSKDKESFLSNVQEFADSDMVDIHVGEDKTSGDFKIHKTILCQKVPYFEKMFDGGFFEGTTNSATLPDDDPETFNIFVSWIYTEKLPLFKKDKYDPERWSIPKLYSLADKLCLTHLMNEILDQLVLVIFRDRFMPNFEENSHSLSFQALIECSPRRNSGVLRVVAAAICFILVSLGRKKGEELHPIEKIDSFLVRNDDLRLEAYKMLRTGPGEENGFFCDPKLDPCGFYHEHQGDEACASIE